MMLPCALVVFHVNTGWHRCASCCSRENEACRTLCKQLFWRPSASSVWAIRDASILHAETHRWRRALSSSILVLPPLTPRSSLPSTPRSAKATPSHPASSSDYKGDHRARLRSCMRIVVLVIVSGLSVFLALTAMRMEASGNGLSDGFAAAAARGRQALQNEVPVQSSGPAAAGDMAAAGKGLPSPQDVAPAAAASQVSKTPGSDARTPSRELATSSTPAAARGEDQVCTAAAAAAAGYASCVCVHRKCLLRAFPHEGWRDDDRAPSPHLRCGGAVAGVPGIRCIQMRGGGAPAAGGGQPRLPAILPRAEQAGNVVAAAALLLFQKETCKCLRVGAHLILVSSFPLVDALSLSQSSSLF